jgi:peptidylprolyl isomerase
MATARRGDIVHVHYTGRLDDGSVFDASEGRSPLAFKLGAGQVIPGFEQAVDGMEVGGSKTVRIPVDEAYGTRRDDLVLEVPRAHLPDDLDADVGARLEMQRQDGHSLPVVVVAADDAAITVDANHPLAGQALTFELRLMAIA